MHNVVLAFSTLATLVAVVAFLRERRWRRALQVLLQRLLTKWKSNGPNIQQIARGSSDCDAAGQRL